MSDSRAQKLNEIARFIAKNADEAQSLESLGKLANMSPHHFQKQFSQFFGLSPKEFQIAARNKIFKQSLRGGGTILDAIYAAGFGSTSRVYEKANEIIGMNPKDYKKGASGETIFYFIRQSSIGKILMAAASKGVCAVEIGSDDDELFEMLRSEFPNAVIEPAANNNALLDWSRALQEYIDAIGPKPEIPLDIRGTIFQQKIWRFLSSLKPNERLSYSELAVKIGAPKAFRAAASACAKNKIAILIPCHQVLRMNGDLGGYKWGLERKAALLEKAV